MKIYGLTTVNSNGFFDGTESETWLFKSNEERLDKAWREYEYHSEFEELTENIIDNKNKFSKIMNHNNYIVIMAENFHIQLEFFEQEIN